MKIEVKDLKVDIQDTPILQSVSLAVGDGEFVSLLGPSGCGKTTLLKTIAGILPASEGMVFIGEEEVSKKPIHKRGAVIVFQDMRLFPNMSVLENVAFPLKMQGISKVERRQIAASLLEKVQMSEYNNRQVSELSGGQQQRVALARALAAKPRLLLLDEPFSALDENLREEMRSLVLELHKEFGMTTILVTHDRAEALSMSDRVVVMFDGEIAQCGTPKEVYNRPANRRVADYFGDCIYVEGKVEAGVFVSDSFSTEVKLPDGDYELLLRSNSLKTDCLGDFKVTVKGIQYRGAETVVIFENETGLVWKKVTYEKPLQKENEVLFCTLDLSEGVFFRKESKMK